MREIVVLGSTGSIGLQALEIVESNPTLFKIVGLTSAGNNPKLLIEQAKKYRVSVVGVIHNADIVRENLPGVEVIDGLNAATEVAAITCDVVLNAITGSVGLAPTLAALRVGNQVALANKESLVAGGDLVMSLAKPGQLIPVDSEHSAIAQCLAGEKRANVSKLILTASGGPFRERSDLSAVTVQEALAHPTWAMGPVVTINSATLMNKGLEIIEAHYLFGIEYSAIEAVIHPQSVIHSMVEYLDGSTIAQASPPNMKGPISYALNFPERVMAATAPINWNQQHAWTFAPVDDQRFPAIGLAKRCGELAGGLPAIFNAANEVAVEAFINQKISFTSIVDIVEDVVLTLGTGTSSTVRDIEDVSAIEQDARQSASKLVEKVAI